MKTVTASEAWQSQKRGLKIKLFDWDSHAEKIGSLWHLDKGTLYKRVCHVANAPRKDEDMKTVTASKRSLRGSLKNEV